jgi:predicted alpha/beta superfamily hydrolase
MFWQPFSSSQTWGNPHFVPDRTQFMATRIDKRVLCLLTGWALIGSLLSIASGEPSDSPSSGSIELLTLNSKVFSNTRTIRVWLPPDYNSPSSKNRKFPVFYFTDGIAVFHGRELDRIASELVAAHEIPSTIFVGIDNGGSTQESKNSGTDRANEYLPFPDEFLQPPLPNPHGMLFPAFFEHEVRRLVESRYRTNQEIGIAGSSYGGAIALYTVLKHPKKYRWLLLESPSLYINHDALLKLSDAQKAWPRRVYVGAGTDEGEGDSKQEMVNDVERLGHAIEGRTATCLLIVRGAQHNEDAWRARLPMALEFLLANQPCPSTKTGANLP